MPNYGNKHAFVAIFFDSKLSKICSWVLSGTAPSRTLFTYVLFTRALTNITTDKRWLELATIQTLKKPYSHKSGNGTAVTGLLQILLDNPVVKRISPQNYTVHTFPYFSVLRVEYACCLCFVLQKVGREECE